ncbi:hypothetical protein LZ198_21660 [Myxococcus sp. K15C18031901]|uniref:hypothetical protein n=1 Tax=Myxococcus dinghuensis TaxID=2906761 RepID=UPI0020A82292|nr:hypothetical protein [Myxococcus dinghuensis]MCP3101486.1 hypothetical protein [Myxococcus dinghuensis]
MRFVAAFAFTSLLFVGCGEGVEEASPAVPQDPAQAGDRPVTAMACQYRVVWSAAGVWEKPTQGSTLLKHKYAGEVVGGYCDWTYYNDSEGVEFFAVSTSSAEDGIGWMKRAGVVKL